ncbi:MAG: hypothetical protein ACR2HJ_06955 [Fimbriimonadales bacterium]
MIAELTFERVGDWIAAGAVIAILSLLWRENRLYRVGEHLLLGLTIGFTAVVTWVELLQPRWLVPFQEAIAAGDTGRIFFGGSALVLGLCWYGLYFKRGEWLMRLVLGVILGASAGQALRNNFTQQMPLVATSFRSPIVISEGSRFDFWGSLNNSLFLVALVSVLLYFFFIFEQRNPIIKAGSRIGRFWLMVGFGVYFGNTIMTRMAVLIERVWFVVNDFFGKMFA